MSNTQVLEQILEEIDVERKKQREVCKDMIDTPGYRLYEKTVSIIKGIIRSHMNDGEDTDVPTNGWIPCSERLPEDSEEIVLVQVSGKPADNIIFENAFALATYASGGGWLLENYPEWENPNVTVWRPLPEPYNPEEPKPAKNTQQELEDFWRDK